MQLIEEKTAKKHGKLLIVSLTLLAVEVFADPSEKLSVFGVKFENEKAVIMLSIGVIGLFFMWLHAFILDTVINTAENEISKIKHNLNVEIPRELQSKLLSSNSRFVLELEKEELASNNWRIKIEDRDDFIISEEIFMFFKDNSKLLLKIDDISNSEIYKNKFLSSANREAARELDQELTALQIKLLDNAVGLTYKKSLKRELRSKISAFMIGKFTHVGLAIMSSFFALCILLKTALS